MRHRRALASATKIINNSIKREKLKCKNYTKRVSAILGLLRSEQKAWQKLGPKFA